MTAALLPEAQGNAEVLDVVSAAPGDDAAGDGLLALDPADVLVEPELEEFPLVRLPHPLAVEFSILLPTGEAVEAGARIGLTTDVGADGIDLHAGCLPPAIAGLVLSDSAALLELRISIDLPGGPWRSAGRVAWVRPPPRADGPWRLGVRFEGDADRGALERFARRGRSLRRRARVVLVASICAAVAGFSLYGWTQASLTCARASEREMARAVERSGADLKTIGVAIARLAPQGAAADGDPRAMLAALAGIEEKIAALDDEVRSPRQRPPDLEKKRPARPRRGHARRLGDGPLARRR